MSIKEEYNKIKNKFINNHSIKLLQSLTDLFHISIPTDCSLNNFEYKFEDNSFIIKLKNFSFLCSFNDLFYQIEEFYEDYIIGKKYSYTDSNNPIMSFCNFINVDGNSLLLMENNNDGIKTIRIWKYLNNDKDKNLFFDKTINYLISNHSLLFKSTLNNNDNIHKKNMCSFLDDSPYYYEVKSLNNSEEKIETILLSRNSTFDKENISKIPKLILRCLNYNLPILTITAKYIYANTCYTIVFDAIKQNNHIIVITKGSFDKEDIIDGTNDKIITSKDIEFLITYIKQNIPYEIAIKIINELGILENFALSYEHKTTKQDILDKYFDNYTSFDNFVKKVVLDLNNIKEFIDEESNKNNNEINLLLQGSIEKK